MSKNSPRLLLLSFISKKWVLLFLMIAVFIPLAYFYRENNVNIRFVDEDENIVTGKLLNKNLVLYKDIFVQHQPVNYFLSQLLQKRFSFSSIYEVIAGHRDFMIFWSFFWGLLLTYFFGLSFLLAFVFMELTKIFLFGNLFLAESLVFYPVCFLLGILLYRRRINRDSSLFLGFLCSFLFFSLLPVWPFVFLFFVFFVLKDRKFIKEFLLGFFLFFLILTLFLRLSIEGYFYNVFFINFNFYVPQTGEVNLFKSFFPFFDIFFKPLDYTKLLVLERLISGLFFFGIVVSLLRGERRMVFSLFLFLGLLNLRYFGAGLDFYRGFHKLPWFSALVFITFFVLGDFLINFWKNRLLSLILVLFIFLFSFAQSKNLLFAARDKSRDYYVNYSSSFDIGQAIAIMKRKDSRLFVSPDQHLIYWQADILPFSEFIFYYPWMDRLDFFRSKIDREFSSQNPDFLFCSDLSLYVCGKASGYMRLKKDGRYTDLYVLGSLVNSLNKQQISQLEFYNFNF